MKYGLLRPLADGQHLGVAWYLFPDEDHNDDGRHTSVGLAGDQIARITAGNPVGDGV